MVDPVVAKRMAEEDMVRRNAEAKAQVGKGQATKRMCVGMGCALLGMGVGTSESAMSMVGPPQCTIRGGDDLTSWRHLM